MLIDSIHLVYLVNYRINETSIVFQMAKSIFLGMGSGGLFLPLVSFENSKSVFRFHFKISMKLELLCFVSGFSCPLVFEAMRYFAAFKCRC